MSYLCVPIHIDALHLTQDQLVVEAMADFSRLPYVDRALKREINPDVANISEEVVSQAFQNENLHLKAGVHLHWSLPDALTRGKHTADDTTFPLVPNRWLVIRSLPTDTATHDQAWIIESDYCLVPTAEMESTSATYYFRDGKHAAPFRYLGRTTLLENWSPKPASSGKYLPAPNKLTAVGYGEPAFTAFYPNCHSVFGFYDGAYTTAPPLGIQYTVVGWYDDPGDDYLYASLKDLPLQPDKMTRLKEHFQWTLAASSDGELPQQMLCYGRLTFSLRQDTAPAPGSDHQAQIALGNTASEALSAFLSHELSPDAEIRCTIEDQLEYIAIGSRLASDHLDLGPKFKEARHDSGFMPVDGGQIWTITPEDPQAARTQKRQARGQPPITIALPEPILSTLNTLNDLQRTYDQAQGHIETMRHQLFADWYKFMLSAYHPPDADREDDYPDIDEVRFFIEEKVMEPLSFELESTGQLHLSKDDVGRVTGASAVDRFTVRLATKDQRDNLSAGQQARSVLQSDWDALLNSPSALPSTIAYIIAQHSINLSGKPTIKGNKTQKRCQIDAGIHQLILTENEGDLNITHFTYGQVAYQLAAQIRQLLMQLKAYNESDIRHFDTAQHSLPHKGFRITATLGADPAFEQALILDGTAQQSVKLTGPAKELKGQPWTLSFAFYATQTDQAIFTIPNAGVPLIGNMTADRRLRLRLGKPGDNQIMIGRTWLSLNQWHHLALAHDGQKLTVYLDGQQELLTPPGWPSVQPAQINLGPKFSGRLTHIRLDNRHLNPGEIRRDMQNAPRLSHHLRQTPAPRYYQPNEPVVLITGGSVRATERHGQDGRLRDDGLLECQIWTTTDELKTLLDADKTKRKALSAQIKTEIDALEKAGTGRPSIAFTYWTEQPWHPIMLEWEVELFPNASHTNTSPAHSGYDPSLIQENYELADNAVDLSVRRGQASVVNGANLYSHQALLSRHTNLQLIEAIDVYLADQGIDQAEIDPLTTREQVDPLYKKHRPGQSIPNFTDPLYTALRAYAALHTANGALRVFLTQNLSGFNQELLMHKQTLQLPLEDPLGFDEYQTFTQKVAHLVGDCNRSAPEPLNAFNPIRTGAMQVHQLRLVDTFGQVRALKCDQIIKPNRLSLPGNQLAWLPPRLVQPARIDFRLFAASHTRREMSADVAHTPVCGWLLPNNLDSSLMVYDGRGRPLGFIRRRGDQIVWASAPGSHTDVAEIPNPHLRRIVQHILGKRSGVNYLEDFLTAIESALETIEPANFAQHQSLALLMGRPLAVVRASVNLTLKGRPAIHQGWTSFRHDMNRNQRETDQMSAVKFPIRVGEYQQLNDGLVGYWLETTEDIYANGRFYAPQTPDNAMNRSIDHPDIQIHRAAKPVNLWQSLADEPQVITILLDPRGVVHATSGILPTKSISLPPHQYAEALAAIQLTFLTTPILTPHGRRSLPVPDEPGLRWSWLEEQVTVGQQRFRDFFGAANGDKVWGHLVDQGWLQPNRTGAKVIAKGQRPVGADGREHLSEALAHALGYAGASRLEEDAEHLLWYEINHLPTIEKYTFIQQYNSGNVVNQVASVKTKATKDGATAWQMLLGANPGWLKPIPAGTPPERAVKALIVPKDQRPQAKLPKLPTDDYERVAGLIEAILENASLSLKGIETEAKFNDPQELREGWLVLRRTEE